MLKISCRFQNGTSKYTLRGTHGELDKAVREFRSKYPENAFGTKIATSLDILGGGSRVSVWIREPK